VQAFANSTYTQRQEFQLGSGAGLVLVDWFTAGRTARGERWGFRLFDSRNEVFINRCRVFLDSVALDSSEADLKTAHRMARFNCMATLLLVGTPLLVAREALLKNIAELPVEKKSSLVCSASPVREGALLRIAGEDVEQTGHELHRQLAFVSGILGDDPWARKW
jgi:urease accessory protein